MQSAILNVLMYNINNRKSNIYELLCRILLFEYIEGSYGRRNRTKIRIGDKNHHLKIESVLGYTKHEIYSRIGLRTING